MQGEVQVQLERVGAVVVQLGVDQAARQLPC
jgi:hypothetical protein